MDQTLVARVYVDLGLANIDRPFDYEVPEAFADVAKLGVRARVKFAGRLRDALVVEVSEGTDQARLLPLEKVVSPEVIAPATSIALFRAVADHYGGSFWDVARLALPPRHAATEKAAMSSVDAPDPDFTGGALTHYPTADSFLAALSRGESPRAGWMVVPAASEPGDGADGLAAAAAATVASGRSAILIAGDAREVDRLQAAAERRVGTGLVVRYTADQGPSARYRAFLRALRGHARVVVGTRAAAFVPVGDLGLIAVWDDGDDTLRDPKAPYPHARDVAAIRAGQQGSGVLFAGHARTAEVQAWLDRGWLHPLGLAPDAARRLAPRVKITLDSDVAVERDPTGRAARLPRDAHAAIRAGLAQGPVLLQSPRAGYLAGLACQQCREPARCRHCDGPLRMEDDGGVHCTWCARPVGTWACAHCGGRRLRAPVVGASRTAEELGRAFPGTVVRRSGQGQVIEQVSDEPCLVVATPGAEPRADGGYAAAILLDATSFLVRAEVRTSEEAFRRWLAATALVRPGEDGGTVVAVGPSDVRGLQALVRVDPAGFAERELADRVAGGFPPAVRLAVVSGEPTIVREAAEALSGVEGVVLLGPAPGHEPDTSRLLAKIAVPRGAMLTRRLHEFVGERVAKKDQRTLHVRVDPEEVG